MTVSNLLLIPNAVFFTQYLRSMCGLNLTVCEDPPCEMVTLSSQQFFHEYFVVFSGVHDKHQVCLCSRVANVKSVSCKKALNDILLP